MVDRFHWIVSYRLAGSAWPGRTEESVKSGLDWLYDRGIRSLVTLTEYPLELEQKENRLRLFHFPIPNYGAPSLEKADEICRLIDQENKANRPVLVHCAAGKGRTGAIGAAYLIRLGHSYSDAVEKIRQIDSAYIENQTQMNFLIEFEEFFCHA